MIKKQFRRLFGDRIIHQDCPDHALTRGRYFYTLPLQLLELIGTTIPHDRLTRSTWDLEMRLSAVADKDSSLVGFWDRRPLRHDTLRLKPAPSSIAIDDRLLKWLGWDQQLTVQQVENSLSLADEPFRRLQTDRRAYCGWLLCNRQFMQEHDDLLHRWQKPLQTYGMPVMGPQYASCELFDNLHVADGDLAAFLEAIASFLRRWELAQLPGPRLPLALAADFTGIGRFQPGHAVYMLANLQLPRTMSLPGAEMSDMLESTLDRDQAGEHLRGWMQLVRKSSTAKHQLTRWSRIFELVHYWRVLHMRHGDACRRRTRLLEGAFAEFLGVEFATIHKDLNLIRSRLGSNWFVT